MGIIAKVTAAEPHSPGSAGTIDPLLILAREDRPRAMPTSSVIRRLQGLQRRLRLDFFSGDQQLGLPFEMVGRVPDDSSPLRAALAILVRTGTFDGVFYRQRAELARAANAELAKHFVTLGWRKGLAPNFYFDPDFYCAQHGACAPQDVNPLFHYLYVGEPAGLRPSPHFDPLWYRTRYSLSIQSPLCHYMLHRHEQRFSPSPDFDVDSYLQINPGIRPNREDPFYHYHFSNRQTVQLRPGGISNEVEPLSSSILRDIGAETKTVLASKIFDPDWYRHRSDQKTVSRKGLVRHYLMNDGAERVNPHPLFSTDFYLRNYGAEIGSVDPLVHYLRDGWRNNFDPHPLFSVRFYLEENEDVRAADREPLQHYLESGWREGRSPCEEFDTAYYLQENDDVRNQGCEPLRHFIDYGALEGRKPSPTFETSWYIHHVLKGESVNPLVHFRANRSSANNNVRSLSLSSRYGLSKRDFEGWTKSFPDPPAAYGSSVDLVRIADVPELQRAVAESRAITGSADAQTRIYLVCDRADEIDTRLLPHLKQQMVDAQLGVFDFAFRKESLWAPVLLPGANPTHIEAVDATFSRFAISDRLLRELDIGFDTTIYGILKAAIAHLRKSDRLDLFKHIPMPILRVKDLSERLGAERLALARASQNSPSKNELDRTGPSVSVVICTKDRCRLLSQLLDSLLNLPNSLVREIVVVTNSTEDSYATHVHETFGRRPRVQILRHEGPYNFSQQSNRGATRCSGELLLFLNDDIVPIAQHWLGALRASFNRAEVGVVGPLLFYPDERVQHAGLYLGYNDIAGHLLRGVRLPDEDYMYMGSAPRSVSAVTGAALLTRRSLFENLNGFDRQLGTYLQDVDYCLRAVACGHEVVFDPRSMLFHMESVSMREMAGGPVFADRRPLEFEHFARRWGAPVHADPFHNPNFDVGEEHLRAVKLGAIQSLDLRG